MEYQIFLNELQKRLKESVPDTGNGNVRFLQKGFIAETEEEKQFVTDANWKYYSENSEVLLGDFVLLYIAENKKHSGICRFSCEYLFAEHKNGGWKQVEHIITENIKLIRNDGIHKAVECFEEYERIKERLIIRPINYDMNKAVLNRMCYKLCGDVALVLYVVVQEVDEQLLTTKIPKALLESWNKSFEDVFENALLNTFSMAAPRMYLNASEVMAAPLDKGKFIGLDPDITMIPEMAAPLVTTTKKTNGAIAMFYPNVRERIAALFDSDYYVVFTSMHEARVHSCKDISAIAVLQNLENAYKIYGEDELLSRKVFRYSKGEKKFEALDL